MITSDIKFITFFTCRNVLGTCLCKIPNTRGELVVRIDLSREFTQTREKRHCLSLNEERDINLIYKLNLLNRYFVLNYTGKRSFANNTSVTVKSLFFLKLLLQGLIRLYNEKSVI